MTRFITLALLMAASIVSAITATAQTTPTRQELVTMADSAYTDDSFDMAADIYKNVIDTYGPSAKLYYNLGNCYYRLGRNGKAVVAYERALRLDPTDADARYNLDFVNARITDRPGERGTFIGNALDAIALFLRADLWAWIAFALFTATVAGVLLYFFTRQVTLRKIGFFGGITTLILFLAVFVVARRAASLSTSTSQAVVVSPSTILSTVPRQPATRAQEAMLLHEGTRVEILDSVVRNPEADSLREVWYDVQVDNAHRAWIDAAAVERI